ncbi:RNA recognition motif [Popillia japonica]|uniref:RNA recognition motif n=1 Tax=Popillia japonica TaxID=7064 RepID=A0AAW1KB01_POPJA
MDAGFLNFHGEEHFSTLDSSYFLESSVGDDTTSYDDERGYTWDWDNERELNGDIGLIPGTGNSTGDYCIMSTSPPSKEDFQKIMMEWQHLVNLETENVEELAIDVVTSNALDTAQALDVIHDNTDLVNKKIFTNNIEMELDTTINSNILTSQAEPPQSLPLLLENIKQQTDIPINETDLDNATMGTEKYNAFEEDPIGHLANSDFDITKYVNETDKYSRNSEIILPSGPGPGGKKLDLKNQRYVIDGDSEDDHIDVETVSEANQSIETDSESSDEENVALKVEPQKILAIKQEFVEEQSYVQINEKRSLQKTLAIKQEYVEGKSHVETNDATNLQTVLAIKQEYVEENSSYVEINDTIKLPLVENELVKQEFPSPKTKTEESTAKCKVEQKSPVIEAGDLNSLLEKFEASETNKSGGKPDISDDNRKDSAKSKQILESLPEELINRIKQSSKRKLISLIPPIPNKKRGKQIIPSIGVSVVNTNNTNMINTCEITVQMDHDYCISANSSKKDSGFSSCEEDERSLLRNQPTVKTADGKLMKNINRGGKVGVAAVARPGSKTKNARRLQRMNIQPCPPPNMEVRTLVSIGVNTDQSWGRLQEIVRGCPENFSPNSLITSLVDHLPEVKEVKVPGEHGEDKTIVYLDKNRVIVKTVNKKTQTVNHRRRSSSGSSNSSRSSRSRTRSPSPSSRRRRTSSEKMREVEERRVIYVGRISNSVTRECLRKRFQRFGPINNVSVHFRRTGDNYGFVTFKYKEDAYEAVEHGNEDPNLPQYDLSFGGRRIFCQTTYADLDNLRDDCQYSTGGSSIKGGGARDNSFEELLRETQAKLLRNKRLNSKS